MAALIPVAIAGSNIAKTLVLGASLNPITAAGISLGFIAIGLAYSISKGQVNEMEGNEKGFKVKFHPLN